ncbi:MAG: asparaginase [Hyphomonadaceae bacterium]
MAKRILVIGTGGTIAMSAGEGGLLPSRTAGDLLGAIAELIPGVEVRAIDPFNKPSANIGFSDVADIAGLIGREAAAGADGVVLVQGTDTIEETAFALELLTAERLPLVVTGAMRGASSLGADGPANLAGAIMAARDCPPGMGVIVLLNDEAHAARWVHKAHTTALNAFSSGEAGLLGRIHEGAFLVANASLSPLDLPVTALGQPWPRIALVRIAMGDDGALLLALPQLGFEGCVIEAMGAGHVPAILAPMIEKLAAQMPVVLASRAGAGRVCARTYAYAGSETDLIRRGVIPAAGISGLKARVLLAVCLRQRGKDGPNAFLRLAALI